MIVLGWHGGIIREFQDAAPGWSTHDGSAVIIRDGNLICAFEEERLNRIKHSNYFPAHAIYNCLKITGLSFDDIDVIAMNFIEQNRKVFPCDAGLPSVNHFLEYPEQRSFSVRDMICELFEREFSADVSNKLFFCNHHIAHLWSAFSTSGFPDALVVSNDGFGDSLSGCIAVGDSIGISILRQHSIEQSLGTLYRDFIRILGYKRFDEYKAMGLAPYGDPNRFNGIFKKMYQLLPEGNFELLPIEERWGLLYDEGLVKQARRAGEPFNEVHKDFAAGLQNALETIVFHVITHFRKKTGKSNLCLAGGVAHNSTLNGKLLSSDLFEKIYVQPASHDAGGAIGAAIAAYEMKGDQSCRRQMPHVFLGRDIGSDMDIRTALEAWGPVLEMSPITEPAAVAAQLISQGEVVGWVQGRSEFGPRSLGNRSIIADPRPINNWTRINKMVKDRESFRPFAPSIIEDKLTTIIDTPKCKADLSFMTFTLPVRKEYREILGAVTHVNGSARIQTVSQKQNRLYWELIQDFFSITGIPAILNTSFNNSVEPIVDTIDDAVVCLLTTGLDLMIVGNYLVTKNDFISNPQCILSLKVQLSASKKLVKRCTMTVEGQKQIRFAIEATASLIFDQASVNISEKLFKAIAFSDRAPTVGELLLDKDTNFEMYDKELFDELIYLWKLRAIRILP
ncbi:carbamoyltransferase family protein [Desulforegula conservatrix]|uniref:carbamoyltransferase family protein n=1 Tax=Desulforegula conservatrix TaxID=153026 RepID=UPI000402D78D|nr:carbamoyltransferase C-terminal domain-containing protein [Desulforegula conservatrix]